VSSPSLARRSILDIFPEEGPSDGQVSIQERNNVERDNERGRVGKVRERILLVVYV